MKRAFSHVLYLSVRRAPGLSKVAGILKSATETSRKSHSAERLGSPGALPSRTPQHETESRPRISSSVIRGGAVSCSSPSDSERRLFQIKGNESAWSCGGLPKMRSIPVALRDPPNSNRSAGASTPCGECRTYNNAHRKVKTFCRI